MSRVILILTITALCAACDGYVGADVEVRDEAGRPLPGVRLQLARDRSDMFTLTDVNGYGSIGTVVAPGRYSVPLYAARHGFSACMVALPTLSRNRLTIVLAQERDGRSGTSSVVSSSGDVRDAVPCESPPEDWTLPEVTRPRASMEVHSWMPGEGTVLRRGDRVSATIRWHVEGFELARSVSVCLAQEVVREDESVFLAAVLGCQTVSDVAGSVRVEIEASELVDPSGRDSFPVKLWPRMYDGDPQVPRNVIGAEGLHRYEVLR